MQLTGTREQIAKAKALVQKIVDEEQAGPWSKLGENEICEDVVLPKVFYRGDRNGFYSAWKGL